MTRLHLLTAPSFVPIHSRAGRIGAAVVVSAFLLLASLPVAAQITPSGDAYIDTTKPTTNYGSATTLGVVSPSQTAFIAFDLSSIPATYTGANVAKASLKLYVNTVTTAGSFNVDFVNGTWSEATLTANNAPALGSTIAASVPLVKAQAHDYLLVDVTTAVQAWLAAGGTNDGIALVANSPLSATFDSKENTTQSHSAELDVVFTSGGTITGITTAAGSGLTGGGTSGTLNLSLLSTCAVNQVLQWSASGWTCANVGTGTITGVTAGTDLTGGGSGGNVTLNLDTTKVPQLNTANTFTGNQTVTGNLTASGTVTAGSFSGSGTGLLGIPQLGANNTFSGNNSFTGVNTFSGDNSFPGVANVFAHLTAIGYGENANVGNVGCGANSAGVTFQLGDCLSYALLDFNGDTMLNRKLGQTIRFRENNVDQMTIAPGGGITVNAPTTTNTSSLTVNGPSSGSGLWVNGSANQFAIVAVADASQASVGVYGESASGTAVWGASRAGVAGYFGGNVWVSGSLSKGGGSFKIDHPLDPANKYLYHSFVESPDMMNIYNGNVVTDEQGFANVNLPNWFETLNRDFRYQLTVIGQFAQAIVAHEVEGNRFTIQTNAPRVKVSWQVTGIRQDAWANAHRIPVEEEKTGSERGRYLHPELFGAPEEQGIGRVHRGQLAKRTDETTSPSAPEQNKP